MTKDQVRSTEEALDLALEALEEVAARTGARWALEQGYAGHLEAITAIKQARSAPVQEPVGEVKNLFTQAAWEKLDVRGSTKVYLGTPPAAQPAPVQPVAIALNTGTKQGVKWLKNVEHGESLYTTQQQRPFVGLTDEERDDLLDNYITAEGRARAIEAKLKEKNNG